MTAPAIIEKFSPFEIEASWKAILADELEQPYIARLAAFLAEERTLGVVPVYPPQELIFNALLKTPYEKVRVVLLGQDPYHGPGQAHGLCFSVPKGIAPPPSLVNIFKELKTDIGMEIPSHGNLISWAEQGVLLLNTTLTVRQGTPMSHHGKGWERLTDAIIQKLAERTEPLVFVLWGKSAQDKCRHLTAVAKEKGHLILTAPHPSPLSAHGGFFGCGHFSKINAFLIQKGLKPIDWNL